MSNMRRLRRSTGGPKNTDYREQLLRSNTRIIWRTWQDACASGESDPVVVVLDLEDPVARQTVTGHIMTHEQVEAHRLSCRGHAHPTIVTSMPRDIAIEFSKETTKKEKTSAILAQGAMPGFLDVLVVGGGSNLLGRIPFPAKLVQGTDDPLVM